MPGSSLDSLSPWSEVSTTWGWTAVGEQHAYRDATGSLTYSRGASNQIGIAVSVNGGAYKISGSASWTASQSFSTGIKAGPMKSYINVLALNYEKEKRTYACPFGGGHGTIYQIVPLRVHNDPGNANWDPYKLGPSVLSEDGLAKWQAGQYKSSLSANQTWCNTTGRSFSYGDGVTVYGVGISDTVQENTSSQQCIAEGSDRKITHRVWGSNAYIWSGPQRFFSY